MTDTEAEAAVGVLDHIAMIVDDLDAAIGHYRDFFHASVSPTEVHARYGFSSAFVDLGYSRLRLLQPQGPTLPVATFFGPHPLAGIHHVCYRVEAIGPARRRLQRKGYRPLGDGRVKRSSQGRRMVFLRPTGLEGPLVKLEEA
jgi:methylmalonyl-CoA/ethylmalonyl-CoA epimerase